MTFSVARFKTMAGAFITFCGFWLTLTPSLAAGFLLQNVALMKTAKQSSGTNADKVIDGYKNLRFDRGVCSLTDEQNNPWWSVDLGTTHEIHFVVISSSDNAEYNLNGVEIWLSNSLDTDVNGRQRCGVISEFEPAQAIFQSCKGVERRFVTLRLPGYRKLCLCEVQVYTKDFTYSQPNVAVKGQAVQSSTLYPAGANRAIDGRRDTFYTESSCSHTQEETAPWWRVDLGQRFIVSKVKVTNRGDCCPERLDGAQIRIGNSRNNNNDNAWCANITHIPLGKTWTFTCASGTMVGRFVNLLLPGDMKILTLCEVEVYAEPAVWVLRNLNQNKPEQTESGLDNGPWNTTWIVNLGAVHKVTAVAVYIRRNTSYDDMIGAQIKIGKNRMTKHNAVCGIISSAERTHTFYCSGIEGQYVSVNAPNATDLRLKRMEVFGF